VAYKQLSLTSLVRNGTNGPEQASTGLSIALASVAHVSSTLLNFNEVKLNSTDKMTASDRYGATP
jgi:hypothetical protein